jgi:hypothetical protein
MSILLNLSQTALDAATHRSIYISGGQIVAPVTRHPVVQHQDKLVVPSVMDHLLILVSPSIH